MRLLPPRSHTSPSPASLHCRYHRIKAMLLNAAAGSAASALKELAFETALAAKHLKVSVLRARVRLRLNHAPCSGASWSATGSTASSAPKLPASNPRLLPMMRTCSCPAARVRKRGRVAVLRHALRALQHRHYFEIYEKYHEAVARARCERAAATCRSSCWSSSSRRTTARRCWRGCEEDGDPQEPCVSSASARQPPSPSRLQPSSTSATAGRERSDGSAVLQAARSGASFVASISGGSAAALTGAVKNAVSTQRHTVALHYVALRVNRHRKQQVWARPSSCSLFCSPLASLLTSLPISSECRQLPLALWTRSLRSLHPAASQALWPMTWTRARAFLLPVVNGDIASVRALVRHGVASSCRNSLMATSGRAREAGLHDMVQLLLQFSRSTVRAFDVNLRRPLHLAALQQAAGNRGAPACSWRQRA